MYYGKRSVETDPDIEKLSDKDEDSTVIDDDKSIEFNQYDKELLDGRSKRPSFKRLHSWMSTYGKRGGDFTGEGKIDGLDSEEEDELEELLKDTKFSTPLLNDYDSKYSGLDKRIPGWSATYGKRIPGWAATYGKRIPGWAATYGKRAIPNSAFLGGYGQEYPILNIKRAPHWSATYGKRIPGWAATYGKRAMWQAVYGKRFSLNDRLNALREQYNAENTGLSESKRTQAWSAFYGR